MQTLNKIPRLRYFKLINVQESWLYANFKRQTKASEKVESYTLIARKLKMLEKEIKHAVKAL